MRKVSIAVVGACLLAGWLSLSIAYAQAPVAPAAPQGTTINVCPPGESSSLGCTVGISEAIAAAGNNGVVIIPAGVFTTSEVFINQSVTVRGAGPAATVVQAAFTPCLAGHQHRVFRIVNGYVRLEGMTVRNGCSEYSPDEPYSGQGGAIWSSSTLQIADMAITDNSARAYESAPAGEAAPVAMGGGIYSVGYLRIDNSSIADNEATATSGTSEGGGWYNRGLAEASNLFVLRNHADGTIRGLESTGGGLYNEGNLTLTYVTLFLNSTTGSGGGFSNTGEVTVRNTAIAKNLGMANSDTACKMTGQQPFDLSEEGVNFRGVPGCFPSGSGDANNLPPEAFGRQIEVNGLRLLALKPGSPLLDYSPCLEGLGKVDALGSPRPRGMRCDAGAYEASLLYMPALVRGPDLPNLQVTQISVEPLETLNSATYAVIKVTISNLGRKSTSGDFWVDLYINPKEAPPLSAGMPWYYLCRNAYCKNELGVSWLTARVLEPGESMVLTSVVKAVGDLRPDINIAPDQTRWTGYFKPGYTELWAVVDSWNGDGNHNGKVAELDEFDNRGGPIAFTVNAATAAAAATAAGTWEELPAGSPFSPRPVRGQ